MDPLPVAAPDIPATAAAAPRVSYWRTELAREREALRAAFLANPDTPRLLREHARRHNLRLSDVAREVAEGSVAASELWRA